jgi:small acid-soluble spore protein P (minor)
MSSAQSILLKGAKTMTNRPKGPKQTKNPDIPTGPNQPYGEPASGNHKDKMRQQGKERRDAGNGM